MSPSLPKRRENPSEPLKRALGLCVRAIAGDGEVQVSFGPGRPELGVAIDELLLTRPLGRQELIAYAHAAKSGMAQ